jgi:3'-phosphoadenosine 5'-phosphosulfate sulfotransferase (PAPS reductase)/FAD synthetase
LKERNGINAVVLTGITKHESVRRAKRKETEHSCVNGQDKIMVHPIFDWNKSDVLTFLSDRNIGICSLYKNMNRIGCVGCPMSLKQMRIDFKNMPNFKKAYINTVQKLIDDKKKYEDFESAEDVVDWWASGMSKKKWFANKKQYELNFNK